MMKVNRLRWPVTLGACLMGDCGFVVNAVAGTLILGLIGTS